MTTREQVELLKDPMFKEWVVQDKFLYAPIRRSITQDLLDGMSFTATAAKYGITYPRVRQIWVRIVRRFVSQVAEAKAYGFHPLQWKGRRAYIQKCLHAGTDLDEILVDDLEFSTRLENTIKWAGIKTVQDLLRYEDPLLRLPNFGVKSLNELLEFLHQYNLELHPRATLKPKHGRWDHT